MAKGDVADEMRSAELLKKVYEARADPRELAESMGLSLGELAAWAGESETVAALRGLRTLADMQTQLILSRYRLTAAAKLLALADQEDSGELARKACVDLLKLDLMPEKPAGRAASGRSASAQRGSSANDPDPEGSGLAAGEGDEGAEGSGPAEERRLLAALEALGQSGEDED